MNAVIEEAEVTNARERAALADRLELEILTHPVRDWVWKVAGEERGERAP